MLTLFTAKGHLFGKRGSEAVRNTRITYRKVRKRQNLVQPHATLQPHATSQPPEQVANTFVERGFNNLATYFAKILV